jgi:hypothetical protein
VNGQALEQPLTVIMDPRVDVTPDALARQLTLETQIIDLVAASHDGYRKAQSLRGTLAELQKRAASAEAALKALKDFDQKAQRLQGAEGGFGGGGGGRGGRQAPAFAALNRSLGSLANVVDGQDAAPTPAMDTAYDGYCKDLATAAQGWNDLLKTDLPAVNAELTKQNLPQLSASPLPLPACK